MEDEFEQWYRQEYRRVLAACTVVSGDYELAREATDEAFARALEAWDRVALMSAPGGWTQTVALNSLRRAARRRRLESALALRTSRDTSVELSLPDLELWAEVGTLPARQRTAVILRYIHDLSERDVAQAMGISRGAASAALAAARSNLRHRFSLEETEEALDE